MSVHIPLSQGLFAIVDDEDFEALSQHRWHAARRSNTVYAAAGYRADDGARRVVLMHREILRPPKGLVVDHINRNGLDNRRENLRIATASQNQANSNSPRGTSRFKGVCWDKQLGKWRAGIKVDRRRQHIGLFHTEDDAARAYDVAAINQFGDFALLNFEVSL